MDKTDNFNLNVPNKSDPADIMKLSENYIALDAIAKDLSDKTADLIKRVSKLEAAYEAANASEESDNNAENE